MRATSCVKPSGIIIIIKSTLSATQLRQNTILNDADDN